MNIQITVYGSAIEHTAKCIAAAIDTTVLIGAGLHGEFSDAHVEQAMTVSGWLRGRLEIAIADCLDQLGEELAQCDRHERSRYPNGSGNLFFCALQEAAGLQHLDAMPRGCYCGTCGRKTTPVWSDRFDAFVPACCPRSELYTDAALCDEMETGEALTLADSGDVIAYNRFVLDGMETQAQHS